MVDFLSAYLIYSFIRNIIGTILTVWVLWIIFYPTIYLPIIKNYNDETIIEKILEKKKIFISGFIFTISIMVFMPSEKDFIALYGITHSQQINEVMIKYIEKGR